MPGMPTLPTTLLPALFRFVPFEASEISRETGRRLVTHIYPNRDEPFHEDLGRKTRRWKIQGFVVGEAADVIRDLMILAVEKPGPGPLIHYKLGLVFVRCESLEIRESVEGGTNVVEFNFDFVESGAYFPVGLIASIALLAKTALVGAAIGIVYAAKSAPTASELASRANSFAAAALKLKDQTTARTTADAFSEIATTAGTMVTDAEATVAAISAAVSTITLPADLRSFLQIAEAFAVSSEYTNLDVMLWVVTLSAAATAAIDEVFVTFDDAIVVRDTLTDSFARLELLIDNADLHAGLLDVKGIMVAGITKGAINLPRVRELTVSYTVPALALAYSLYGDAERASEIVDRNNLSDPTHVAGVLKVLSV